ncbi:DUF485 domain-containing protein [Streptomyces sp. H39-S7]|uniref:DUF485 domain-containing protein n=1 Tax=Streptomyces sp. H39-S7 TaxID=3004357 RepID=UPI0022AEF64F|nr:DUF485 domain-containing protein [Streptomyces sp. H39-S7]MCZ4124935.1 DUF485 domain-containing protein [Streptomyces sp. H39-S7]
MPRDTPATPPAQETVMAQHYAPRLHHRPRPQRPGLLFALVNGVAFGAHLLLASFAADLLATRIWGQTTIGMLALLAQGALLLLTAALYDRSAGARDDARKGDRDAS